MPITSAEDTYSKLRKAALPLQGTEPMKPSPIVNGPKSRMPEYSPTVMNKKDSSTQTSVIP